MQSSLSGKAGMGLRLIYLNFLSLFGKAIQGMYGYLVNYHYGAVKRQTRNYHGMVRWYGLAFILFEFFVPL